MSESKQEAAEEQTEADENPASEQSPEAPSEGDQPEIDPDEQADIGNLEAVAEQVEAEVGASTPDEDEESSDEAATGGASSTSMSALDSWGDIYVDSVTAGLNAVIDEHGTEGASHIDKSLARDLNLDVYVNKWMNEQDVGEMDPGKGMLISTATLCLIVLISKTDLPQKALSKAQDHD